MSLDYLFTPEMDEATKQKLVWAEFERGLKLAFKEILRLRERVNVLEERNEKRNLQG